MERTIACAAVCALAWAVGPASAGSSTNVEIRANVPIVCSANLVSVTQVSSSPLQLTANVHRNCNSVHTLSVSYTPTGLSNPSSLQMVFDGSLPTGSSAGTVTFGNLPLANSNKILSIAYNGTAEEHAEITGAIAIAVSVP
jgi:hypothetical protein